MSVSTLFLKVPILLLALLWIPAAYATTYSAPPTGDALIGDIQYVGSFSGATLQQIGAQFDLGVNEIGDANPTIDPFAKLSYGTQVMVPTEFILPMLPRRGIIINLPEMRLYYYPLDTDDVMTFPVGIGKVGKTIPLTNTSVARKVVDPVWIPPNDIREYNRKKGIILPDVMPAGPDNPLGPYAIYLRIPSGAYRIHSTIFPESIGRRASFGCIRMLEADIQSFFPLVTPNTPVAIVDMPTKVGWEGNHLYLEAHEPLEERQYADYASLQGIVRLIEGITYRRPAMIDWQLVQSIVEERDGVPHVIGVALS